MQELADPQADAEVLVARFMTALDLWNRHTIRRDGEDA
jgi:hypothetical protein